MTKKTLKKQNKANTPQKKRKEKFPPALAELLKHPSGVALFEKKGKKVFAYFVAGGVEEFRTTILRMKPRFRGKSWILECASFAINKQHIEEIIPDGSRNKITFKGLTVVAYISKQIIHNYIPDRRKKRKTNKI